MNKLQMTFGDNDFIKWYENLSKKEQEEVWKEIKKHIAEETEKYLQHFVDIKDINIGDPCTFTVEKFINLSNNVYLRYKNKEE